MSDWRQRTVHTPKSLLQKNPEIAPHPTAKKTRPEERGAERRRQQQQKVNVTLPDPFADLQQKVEQKAVDNCST